MIKNNWYVAGESEELWFVPNRKWKLREQLQEVVRASLRARRRRCGRGG